MKKTIALVLAMMFALCAFVTAFADNETTTTTAADTTATTEAKETTTVKNDDPTDFESTTATTAKADDSTTTTTATADGSTTTVPVSGTSTTTMKDVTVTVSGTAYEGQGDEGKTTTKKPASVDSTIPSTGSGIVVPAIALLALAAGTVAVIKTKKED